MAKSYVQYLILGGMMYLALCLVAVGVILVVQPAGGIAIGGAMATTGLAMFVLSYKATMALAKRG